MIVRDELRSGGEVVHRDKGVEKPPVKGRLLRVSCQPTAVLRFGHFRRQSLRADHAENAFKRGPGTLLGGRRELFRNLRGSAGDGGKRLDHVERPQPAMIEIREGQLGSCVIRGLFREILPVHFGGIKIQLLFIFERSQRVQLRITGLFLEQISQSRSCLFRRPAKRHFTAWERHPPEKCGFDLRTPFNIPNPGRKSTTRRGQPAGGKNREHSATQSDQELARNFRARFQGPLPASRCCAQRLHPLPSACICLESSVPESQVARRSRLRAYPISVRQERLLPIERAASACFAKPRPSDPPLGPGGNDSCPTGFGSREACWQLRKSSIRGRCARPCRAERGVRYSCRPAYRSAQRSAFARYLHRRDSEVSAPGRTEIAQPRRQWIHRF